MNNYLEVAVCAYLVCWTRLLSEVTPITFITELNMSIKIPIYGHDPECICVCTQDAGVVFFCERDHSQLVMHRYAWVKSI